VGHFGFSLYAQAGRSPTHGVMTMLRIFLRVACGMEPSRQSERAEKRKGGGRGSCCSSLGKELHRAYEPHFGVNVRDCMGILTPFVRDCVGHMNPILGLM